MKGAIPRRGLLMASTALATVGVAGKMSARAATQSPSDQLLQTIHDGLQSAVKNLESTIGTLPKATADILNVLKFPIEEIVNALADILDPAKKTSTTWGRFFQVAGDYVEIWFCCAAIAGVITAGGATAFTGVAAGVVALAQILQGTVGSDKPTNAAPGATEPPALNPINTSAAVTAAKAQLTDDQRRQQASLVERNKVDASTLAADKTGKTASFVVTTNAMTLNVATASQNQLNTLQSRAS